MHLHLMDERKHNAMNHFYNLMKLLMSRLLLNTEGITTEINIFDLFTLMKVSSIIHGNKFSLKEICS